MLSKNLLSYALEENWRLLKGRGGGSHDNYSGT